MSTAAEELLAEALKLAPEDREFLAAQIMDSLEHPPAPDIDWEAEIKRRIEESDSGVPGIPGEVVMARAGKLVADARLRVP